MNIYNYDPISLVYLGESIADPSPMEPGRFIVPAFATANAPGEIGAGFLAFYVPGESRWELRAQAGAEAPEAAPAEPTFQSQVDVWRVAVREHANVIARAFDFDSIDEAVSYAGEPAVPRFQMEGQALRAWRSRLWEAFGLLVLQIKGGDQPAFANESDLRERLPAFEAPDTSQLGIERFVSERAPEVAAPAPVAVVPFIPETATAPFVPEVAPE